jgi:hypothetical protein
MAEHHYPEVGGPSTDDDSVENRGFAGFLGNPVCQM